jgi:hypothetical protein
MFGKRAAKILDFLWYSTICNVDFTVNKSLASNYAFSKGKKDLWC